MDKKPKHKAKSFKKMGEIERIDEKTFYVKRSNPEEGDPYLVFNSQNIGWCCDCMSFVMSMTDTSYSPPCKHILRIQKQFNLT